MHLDPASAVFEAMLEGWARQQRTRFLKWDSTIKPRLSLVRRLAAFSSQYRWEWQRAEVEAFFDHVRANNPRPILPLRSSPTYWACTSTLQSDGSDTPDVIGPTTSPPETPNRTRRLEKPENSAGPEYRLFTSDERNRLRANAFRISKDAKPR